MPEIDRADAVKNALLVISVRTRSPPAAISPRRETNGEAECLASDRYRRRTGSAFGYGPAAATIPDSAATAELLDFAATANGAHRAPRSTRKSSAARRSANNPALASEGLCSCRAVWP